MSSGCTSKSSEYYQQMRQKNNEAARNSRYKKKVAEIEICAQKRKLEVTYVKLKKEIIRIQVNATWLRSRSGLYTYVYTPQIPYERFSPRCSVSCDGFVRKKKIIRTKKKHMNARAFYLDMYACDGPCLFIRICIRATVLVYFLCIIRWIG